MTTDGFSPADSLIDFNDCSQVELASLANKVGQFLSIMEHFGEAEEILLDAHQSLTEVGPSWLKILGVIQNCKHFMKAY